MCCVLNWLANSIVKLILFLFKTQQTGKLEAIRQLLTFECFGRGFFGSFTVSILSEEKPVFVFLFLQASVRQKFLTSLPSAYKESENGFIIVGKQTHLANTAHFYTQVLGKIWIWGLKLWRTGTAAVGKQKESLQQLETGTKLESGFGHHFIGALTFVNSNDVTSG